VSPLSQRDRHDPPGLIAGDAAGWRYVEFFTANIRNPNTRRAYARACARFFAWCDGRGLTLTAIRPHDVATCIETLQQTHSAPGVKQQLAAVRMLFDWLIAVSNPHKMAGRLHDRPDRRSATMRSDCCPSINSFRATF
jgi:site-specific recombinase XerD